MECLGRYDRLATPAMHPNGVVGVTIGITVGASTSHASGYVEILQTGWTLVARARSILKWMVKPWNKKTEPPMPWGERGAATASYGPTDFCVGASRELGAER